ncbi:MAG: ABC transporter permease [Fimbriimonadaceae bacterium]|nr:ABC transporter permease [Alphaproteobacteria bacterium]
MLIVPAVALLFTFFVLPYFSILAMSIRTASARAPYGEGYTLAHFTNALSDDYILGVLMRTVSLGLIVTVITLVLGYPVAYHLARTRSRWKGLLYTFVLSPLLVGLVVRTFGWMIILSNNGVAVQSLRFFGLIDTPIQLMNNNFGVGIALVHVFLPFIILPLLGNIQAINPDLEAAARSLGASRFKAFLKVTLPLSIPGIQAGTILVFVLSISAYVTPAMLGGARAKTMSVLVIQYLVDSFRWPAGAALALILAMTAIVSVLLYFLLTNRIARRLP